MVQSHQSYGLPLWLEAVSRICFLFCPWKPQNFNSSWNFNSKKTRWSVRSICWLTMISYMINHNHATENEYPIYTIYFYLFCNFFLCKSLCSPEWMWILLDDTFVVLVSGYIEEACSIPCPSDCKLSEWSNWSRCSKSCGSGVKVRSKWLREKRYNGGRPCPKLDQTNQVLKKKKKPDVSFMEFRIQTWWYSDL